MDTGDTSKVCCCFPKDTQECPNPLDLDYSDYDYSSLGVKNGAKPVMVSISFRIIGSNTCMYFHT